MIGLCFSIHAHGCFSFLKKLFFTFFIFTSLFNIDIKKFQSFFKEVLKIPNEKLIKLSILEFAKLSPSEGTVRAPCKSVQVHR